MKPGCLRLMLAVLFTLTFNYTYCQANREILIPFSQAITPPAPDYSNPDSWGALPTKKDNADLLPSKCSLTDNQATAPVDVFYIHPTTFWNATDSGWNASITDIALNKTTDDLPVKYQSTVFNGSGKIYAPRYRQAHIRAFFNLNAGGKQALDIAYSDVKAAFEYYLDHYNDGRPFIIASHSQGSAHAQRLLAEYIEGKPLQERFIVAYLVGFPVYEHTFQQLKPCADAKETGCYVSWYTYAADYYPDYHEAYLKNAIVVNPVSWTTDTVWTEYSLHKGYVGKSFGKIRGGLFDACIHDGMLWVGKPRILLGRFVKMKDFHIADYNLFWMDIRENVATRVAHYMAVPVQSQQ